MIEEVEDEGDDRHALEAVLFSRRKRAPKRDGGFNVISESTRCFCVLCGGKEKGPGVLLKRRRKLNEDRDKDQADCFLGLQDILRGRSL